MRCTGAVRCVDTDVLVYGGSSSKADRAKAAQAAVLLDEPDLALSVHVLQEFTSSRSRAGRVET